MSEIEIDPNDPHFIHNNDLITGVKLVNTPFEGTGFGKWKRSMLIALSAKNKIGFIDGTIPKPASTTATAKQWQRCNDIVFSWILSSVSSEIADSILYSNSAKDAWVELEERFGQSNGAQLYEVHKKLNDFAQGNDSIVTYFTKLKSIWDEIAGMGMNPNCSCGCTCGAKQQQSKFQEDKKVVEFLMGLNDSYGVIRGTILLQNPLPKMIVLYNNLLQEERQREIHNTVSVQADSAALHARNTTYNKGGSYNTGFQKGNSSNYGYSTHSGYNNNGPKNNYHGQNKSGNYNPSNGNYKKPNFNQSNDFRGQINDSEDRSTMFCKYCKKFGHIIQKCRHLENTNRRFAGNAYQDSNNFSGEPSGHNGNNLLSHESGQLNTGHGNSEQHQASTSTGNMSSAKFAGLFHEALDSW